MKSKHIYVYFKRCFHGNVTPVDLHTPSNFDKNDQWYKTCENAKGEGMRFNKFASKTPCYRQRLLFLCMLVYNNYSMLDYIWSRQ